MADGNIFKKGNTWQFALGLNVKDRSHLEELCDDLRIGREAIRTYERTTEKGNKQTLVRIDLCHLSFQEWLMRWGIVPRKSYNFLEPKIPFETSPTSAEDGSMETGARRSVIKNQL